MAKLIDLIGQKFEKLTVIERVKNNSRNQAMYRCLCDCGNYKITEGNSLRRGFSKSCGCRRSLPVGESSFRALYRYTEYNAWYRGIEWKLNQDFFRWITKQSCHYCGKEPSQVYKPKRHNGEYIYNGVDRVNNNIGYIEENCVPCCGYCNWMKSAAEETDFKEWVIRVYHHWAGK